nr:hypothetical protein [Tanacetum cinerariifolium]
MLTKHDIYAASLENRPPMLNKDNYIPWSSRIIRYARSRPNGTMLVDSIENGPYIRRMIATLREPDLPVPVPKSFHQQTDEELIKTDIKRMDADDQAIQTILLGLPEDVYVAVDSCETSKEIWEHVRQMMKGSDIGEQEKKAKLFNEWEKFMSTDGESIESFYHRFMQLMNDLKRNKHFPKNIASNLKFLNNLQPEWKRHVTILRQTKNLHEADFTQIYDFLKMNQEEVNELRAKCLVKSHDPLALMAHSQNSFNFPITYKDQSSSSTHLQQSFPINNKYNPQPPLNQNIIQPPMTSLEDINDPTEAMSAALIFFAKAFQLSVPTNNNQRTSSNPRNHQIARPVMNMGQDRQIQNVRGNGGNQFGQYAGQVAQNQQGFNAWQNGGIQGAQIAGVQSDGNQNGAEGTRIGNQARCYNYRGLGHIARNCITMPRRRDAAYLQTYRHLNLVLSVTGLLSMTHMARLSMVHSGGTVETSSAPNEEIRAHQETVYRNLVDQVAQEKEYAVLWNNWYTKCEECKYDKISYDKAYNKMQQKVERLQAQLRDLKSKSSNTPSASNTLDPLNQTLESKIVELEFQVVNYECEISHLKTTYKNLFNSIKSNQAHTKLHDLIFKNSKLRARLFENTSESVKNTSGTSVTPHVDKPKLSAVTPHSKKLHASTQSHFVPQPSKFNVVRHRNVITPGMFKINPSQMPRVDLVPNKQSGLVHTARTKRPQPKGNTRNVKVPSASKSSEVKKIVTVEDHHRTLLLSMSQKTMSSECNNIKLAIRNDKSKIICDTCKQCLVTANHDACLTPSMNVLNSRANKLCAKVPYSANQKRHRTQVWKPKQVGFKERIASKPKLPRLSLKWSPSRRSFDQKGKLVSSKGINYPNDDKACTSNPHEPMRKCFPNSSVFLGRLSKFVCGGTLASSEIWMVLTCSKAEAIATTCYTQNHSIIYRHFNKTPYELIQGRKPDISYLYVFGALCYPKNDREDIGKLGTKGDIGFFIGYSTNFVAYRVYNWRTRKIIETMNVTFDELSAMAFEQNSSRPGLQSMTYGQITSKLELTYAPSTITPQRPSERDLDILFKPLHNEYLLGIKCTR